jgi:hypothetical protein
MTSDINNGLRNSGSPGHKRLISGKYMLFHDAVEGSIEKAINELNAKKKAMIRSTFLRVTFCFITSSP